ncbi:MAG TPA: HD domain-containing phosphohydrolase [Candidatus Saccharicenans sp.]|nr:HD domain-containing phosphohydrolase [Candidatus Saccharicenans sp.]
MARGKKEVQDEILEYLETSEYFNQNLNSQGRSAIFIARQGKIEFANGATRWILGYSPDEMVDVPVEKVFTLETAQKIFGPDSSQPGQPGECSLLELTVLNKNGQEIPVEAEVAVIDYKGSPSTLAILHHGLDRQRLGEQLKDGLEKLKKTFGAIIEALNKLVEARDPYTGSHQRRVADLARAIGLDMGLAAEVIDGLSLAAMVHDVGKVAVPSEILNKPGPLSKSEWGLIKNHPRTGHELLKDIEFPWPVADIILQHHERLDGSGYPDGLKEGEIKLEARILAVADVVEAMSSLRPYREPHPLEETLQEVERNKGLLYDPEVVDVCLWLFREKGYKLKEDYR